MKSTLKMLAALVTINISLAGCGGGGGNSSSISPQDAPAPSPITPTAAPEDAPAPSPITPTASPDAQPTPSDTLPNLIEINPLRDLGLGKNDLVCFRIKSYNNVAESDLSDAACSVIKNDLLLTLSWSEVLGNIHGYYVYFGTNKNSATEFLADVTES